MKIATRKFPLKDRYDSLPEPETIEDKVLTALWCFLTMVETIQSGNTKFSFNDIIPQWWNYTFMDIYPEARQINIPHDIVKVASGIYLKSCKQFKVIPGKRFIKLNNKIQSNNFNSYGKSKVKQIAKLLTGFTLLEVNIN